MFDKFFSRQPGGKEAKKPAGASPADAGKTGLDGASGAVPSSGGPKASPEPVVPVPGREASKTDVKEAVKPAGAASIPDVKTLKIDRSIPRETEKVAEGGMVPAGRSEPGKEAVEAGKREGAGALAVVLPGVSGSGPGAAAERKTADGAKSAQVSGESERGAKVVDGARGGAGEATAKEPARPGGLPAPVPPAGLLAAPTKVEGAGPAVGPKPVEPAAPKAAQFLNLPAKDEWCPREVAEHYPGLRAHIYEDNAATERVLPGGWRVVGATRRGRQHAHKATHREDALAFGAGEPFAVLCVSDGAGSCALSRLGSHVAVRTVTERLTEELGRLDRGVAGDADKLKAELGRLLTAAQTAACQALVDMAAKTKTVAKDYRCTLLTLLHWRGEKHELWLANQIGDGAILVLNRDGSTRRVGEADSGQFSGEVSCFVPDDNAREKAKRIDFIGPAEAVECVLLCTDGIEDPFFPVAKKAGELFRQLYLGVSEPLKDFKMQPVQPAILAQEGAAGALGQWLEFEKRGENDDRTVLLMQRRPVTVTF